jgi:hypothetical protein
MTIYKVIVDEQGTTRWFSDDNLHRENGPAIEYANGDKEYYLNGERHRENGPAVEWTNGDKVYYLNGIKLTETKFNQKTKKTKKSSCEGKMVEIDGVKYKLVSI